MKTQTKLAGFTSLLVTLVATTTPPAVAQAADTVCTGAVTNGKSVHADTIVIVTSSIDTVTLAGVEDSAGLVTEFSIKSPDSDIDVEVLAGPSGLTSLTPGEVTCSAQPERPVRPAQPARPEQPETPARPEQPEQPETPERPEQPKTPETPETIEAPTKETPTNTPLPVATPAEPVVAAPAFTG